MRNEAVHQCFLCSGTERDGGTAFYRSHGAQSNNEIIQILSAFSCLEGEYNLVEKYYSDCSCI